MEKLLLGNEALARGLYEASVKFVSSYPGTPSTEITEEVAKYDEVYAEWAPNEKVALESAFFSSLHGNRSFCAMKHVGLNVAADPLFTISYTGVNAGLVIVVADDPSMHSSQNEQDSRHYAIATKLPMLEPSDSVESKEFAKLAYELSEKYDTPIIIRMCTRVAHSQSKVELVDRIELENKKYEKNIQKYVMVPAMAKGRHKIIEERLNRLVEYAEMSDINYVDVGENDEIGIITSSSSYQYVKEVFGNKYNVLKLGMINPLPVKKILNFASKVKKVYVVEELDDIIETHCKKIGVDCVGKEKFSKLGELTQNSIKEAFGLNVEKGKVLEQNIPSRPPVLCSGCPHRGIYYLLKKNNLTVLGDIGCYSLGMSKPLDCLDSIICMGASVSGIHGFNKLNKESSNITVCVIGDSTFIHSGITGLINIAYNESNSKVIVLDNSTTGMTGHQENPTTGKNLKGEIATKINIEELCKSIGIKNVRVIDPYDLVEAEKVLKEELEKEGASVIVSRRPCALLKNVKHFGPIEIDTNKCVGCKSCMKIGCPSISMVDGKAKIDKTLCVGCFVCSSLCKTNAIPSKKEVR